MRAASKVSRENKMKIREIIERARNEIPFNAEVRLSFVGGESEFYEDLVRLRRAINDSVKR